MTKTIVTFDEASHKYTDNLGREYISVTQLIQAGEPEFNAQAVAEKVSQIPSSKYYRMPVSKILEKWLKTAPLGTQLHYEIEQYINTKVITESPIFQSCVKQFSKLKFEGKLKSETIFFNEEYLIAGTVDLLEETANQLYLYDIKTSTVNKQGELHPDKLEKYTLQLNLYKWLIEQQWHRSCQIIGIIWFKDFVEQQEKTKLTIIPVANNLRLIYNILKRRKLLM